MPIDGTTHQPLAHPAERTNKTCWTGFVSDLTPRQLLQRGFQFLRLESEGPGLALVNYSAALVDQVEPVGPPRVRLLGRIAKLIEHGWNRDAEFAHAGPRDHSAIVFTPRARKHNIVLDVAGHLPNIRGMRFRDVDDQKGYPVLVVIVELVEGGHLPPERRSGVAPKDKHDGLIRS